MTGKVTMVMRERGMRKLVKFRSMRRSSCASRTPLAVSVRAVLMPRSFPIRRRTCRLHHVLPFVFCLSTFIPTLILSARRERGTLSGMIPYLLVSGRDQGDPWHGAPLTPRGLNNNND